LLLFRRTISVSLHRLISASMGSFPAVFATPSRNREYPDTFLHSAEVVTCTHRRSTPCYTIEPRASCTLPWCEAQSMIRANHCSLPWPCIPTLLRLQLRFATLAGLLFGSCRPRHTCPWQWVTPPVFITHCGNTGLGTLPPLLPQSIIDRQNRGIIRGIPPIPKLRAGRQLLQNGTSVDMQEGKDTSDSSVPFQILWLTVFYDTRITGDIGY
jgi:hypothetical protein